MPISPQLCARIRGLAIGLTVGLCALTPAKATVMDCTDLRTRLAAAGFANTTNGGTRSPLADSMTALGFAHYSLVKYADSMMPNLINDGFAIAPLLQTGLVMDFADLSNYLAHLSRDLINGHRLVSYAGRAIGEAWHPEPRSGS